MKQKRSIYIHIPFCINKCYYCNFNSYANKDDLIEEYIQSLKKEILSNIELLSNSDITSIYIGGGTPSYINSKYIKEILDLINMITLIKDIEITIECNPNSITETKVKDYIDSNINRFSIGLQSTDDNILKSIGRKHTLSDFLKGLDILKKYNIDNISLDLMYPLPNMDLNKFKQSMNDIIGICNKYALKHISIYNLELYEKSKLKFLIDNNFLSLVNEDEEYMMKEYLENILKENKFKKYEISNFSKENYESKHNINYWKQGEYISFGVSASSYINNSRYTNIDSIEQYIDYYLNDNTNIPIIKEKEDMSQEEVINEYVILNLRLTEGLNLQKFYNKFKIDFKDKYKEKIKDLENKKLIQITDNNICLSKKGFEISNIVFEEFI